MRVPRTTGRRRLRMSAVALALVLPLVGGATTTALAVPAAAAPVQAAPVRAQNDAGASVSRVDWLTDRRVAVWVNSPSMGVPIQVQILLARDWNRSPGASFPTLWLLDGMRATDVENGWTAETDAETWFADKNVNVILPVGGQSSFYSDWVEQNNGRNYKWETFLTKELPPVLERDWRSTDVRAVAGLSMGGTAAMTLAARNPGFFRFAGSFSGILSTSTLGMPQAIGYAMQDAGGFDVGSMWGVPSGDLWAQHDPYVLAEKLKGTSLYISSGSGAAGPYDQPSDIPGISTNYAGMGLEILARLTSQTFATKLTKLGIPATVNYRPSGVHTWDYWQFEVKQAWPQIAAALGVEVDKPACSVGGAIGGAASANGWLGDCLTAEYDVAGGRAQDFRVGRIFTSDSGTHVVAGAIGGAYAGLGGPAGVLGMPTSGELGVPDGRGRYNSFRNGMIYWTPQTGAHAVRGAILDEWARQGYERGPLGYPTRDEVATPNRPGAVQGFEIGAMYFSPDTGTHAVLGKIMEKYGQTGWENGPLGFARTNEIAVRDNGRFTQFEGGNIYWSPATGAWVIRNGPIFDAWKSVGYENGRLGYVTSDEFPIPGGVQQNFQNGFVTVRDGNVQIVP
ncbi:alpha/beta hydrolase-fold protein [Rhodococcoides corynebacterioides]|uniref:alpha/beta hydrolase-fold protein n=1 Tax=Rhodococcoides corynebacterioides TaxID=53972 RepID=UPI000829AE1E|nr:alpha/beta hydrolase-fold protein [Rhodococcus corynebacterioides]